MLHRTRLGYAVAGLVALAGVGCARAPQADSLQPRPMAAQRVAALDSASAHRLCAAPDSVLAGRAACVLRNQAPPPRVF